MTCFSSYTRNVNLANATHELEESEQLTQACDPASFGLKEKEVVPVDEIYHEAGKMDLDRFASPLHPVQTDLMKIIHGHLLEGTQSLKYVVVELLKLNVYSTGSIFITRS